LRGIHLPRGGGAAWRGGRDGQDPDAGRADPAARLPGDGLMRLRRTDPHTLAGAYALDALGEADREKFERHLLGCEACHAEAASLRDAAGWLAEPAPAVPPPPLPGQVLAPAAPPPHPPPP